MKLLERHLEALIFVADPAISLEELHSALEETFETQVALTEVEEAIGRIIERYQSDDYAFEVVQINEGYKFLTKGAYHTVVSNLLKLQNHKKLSTSAMETLSIIAYKQPVTKNDIELIRGVNSDYSVSKLLEKEFICIVGRSEDIGRPLLYGTSSKFLDYFGLSSMDDLPKIKDFEEESKESIGKKDADVASPEKTK